MHGTLKHLTTAELHLGDCCKLLSRLETASVHLALCDLPYGQTECLWDRKLNLEKFWTELMRVMTPSGIVVMTTAGMFSAETMISNPEWYKYSLVWDKTRATGFYQAKCAPLRAHEDVLVFSPAGMTTNSKNRMTYNPQSLEELEKPVLRKPRTGPKMYGSTQHKAHEQRFTNYPISILRFPSVTESGEKRFHDCQKPVALLEYLIRTYSNRGETILDPTMGSGSTGVAAANAGRQFIGFELSPRYLQISAERIGEAGAIIKLKQEDLVNVEDLILSECGDGRPRLIGALLRAATDKGIVTNHGSVQNAADRLVQSGRLRMVKPTSTGRPSSVALVTTSPLKVVEAQAPVAVPPLHPAFQVLTDILNENERLSRELTTARAERDAANERLARIGQLAGA